MSMTSDIMKRDLLIPSAYEIWSVVSNCKFSHRTEKHLITSKQNGKLLSGYYGKLSASFLELDHRDKVVMIDLYDVTTSHRAIDRLRLHIFLTSLDNNSKKTPYEILSKDSIPKLEECYALICREVTHHATLLEDSNNLDVFVIIA